MPTIIGDGATSWGNPIPTPKKAASKKLQPKPSTPFIDFFRRLAADGHTKNERKSRVKQYVAEKVDESNRTNGRYADSLYDPAAYKQQYDGGKLFGKITGGLIKDSIDPALAAKLQAIGDSARNSLCSRMRHMLGDANGNVFNSKNRKWFVCRYANQILPVSEGTWSETAGVWVSQHGLQTSFHRSTVQNGWVLRERCHRFAPTVARYQVGEWDWIDRDFAREAGIYRFIERHSAWVPEAIVEELGLSLLNEDGNAIGGYHSSRNVVGKIPSAQYDGRKLPLLMGLELEVEATGLYSPESVAHKWLKMMGIVQIGDKKHRYCATEHDGSLSNGFECVTGYTGLDVHAKALAPLKDRPFRDDLRSHETTTCGLHVHIDRMNMTPLHAYKLNLFINDKANQKLMYAIARRYNHDRYAAMAPKEGDAKIMGDYVRRLREAHPGTLAARAMPGVAGLKARRDYSALMRARYKDIIGSANGSRYQAVNFSNRNTVEYRLFRGSLRYETIMACLEFTRASWLFAYQLSKNEMTTEAFLKFICEPANRPDTKFLREYLTLKGFDTKERTEYEVPKTRLQQVIIEAEDPALNLPAPKKNKLYQPQAVAA